MTVDQASNFLASTILTGLGVLLVVIVVVIINNILNKYWKPVKIWLPGYIAEPQRFATPEEIQRIAPHLEEETKSKK